MAAAAAALVLAAVVIALTAGGDERMRFGPVEVGDSPDGVAVLSASARAGSVTAQRELLALHERLVAAGEGDDGS